MADEFPIRRLLIQAQFKDGVMLGRTYDIRVNADEWTDQAREARERKVLEVFFREAEKRGLIVEGVTLTWTGV